MIPVEIQQAYGIEASCRIQPLTNGLINVTYRVTCEENALILQQLNQGVFKDLDGMMQNIQLVQETFQKSESYIFPKLVATIDDSLFTLDDHGRAWRAMEYIPDSRTLNSTNDPQVAFEKLSNFLDLELIKPNIY